MMDNRATVDAEMTTTLEAMAEELMDPRMQRQMELETEMMEDGAHRYWDRVNKARPGTDKEGRYKAGEESRTPTSQCLLRASLNPVRDGLRAFLDNAAAAKGGRRPMAVKRLQGLDLETIAFLTLKRCLDAFSVQPSLSALCIKIGRTIEDECRLRAFEAQAAPLLAAIRERFKTDNFTHHRRVINGLAGRFNIELGDEWKPSEALQVGAALLTIVIETTGLFETITERVDAKTSRITVRPTAETLAWAGKRDISGQYLLPTYMPMVVRPLPWTGPTGGGYRFALNRKLRLVKNRNRGYQSELRGWDMPEVYRAVNALQDTAWQVNPDILPVMSEIARTGRAFAGIPDTAELPIPEAPAGIPRDRKERTPAQHDRLMAWKNTARVTYEDNLERRARGLTVARTLAIAERYAGEEAIFFPYTLDFRGRAYPAAAFLQPQGTDFQKALLRFAEGKPLGEQGACWLAIHGANTMAGCPETGAKLDKAPLQDRIDWVEANEARILAAAADPLGNPDWWTQADSPWQFLAFCFEWAGFLREGNAFLSRLPVALDGSCNGLQHFSAMLRDEVGGSAVNLIPHAHPADIYMEVCLKAVTVCELDSLGDDPEKAALARAWLDSGQLDRGLCKRPVMTMPYGSKAFGIRDQLRQELGKRGFEFHNAETGEVSSGWAECGYMAGVIWQALAGVVVKAREAMDWLQTAAKVSASQELPITWVTPDGFPVLQDYRETFERKVETQVAGKVLWPRLTEEKEDLSKHRQSNGVAPNFVHSMDGAAMRRCINLAMDHGIETFAMIHDSYATHAGDTEAFFRLIRVSFSNMYQEADVLDEFRQDLIRQFDDEHIQKLPPLPTVGNLDLEQLIGSDFFFA